MNSAWDLRQLQWKRFLKELWGELGEDRVTSQAAQLAFYFIFSVFPLLLTVTAVAGLFLQSDSLLLSSLQKYLHSVVPDSVSGLIVSTLKETTQASNAGKISFGLLATLWAASNGLAALIEALNIIYDVPEARAWWKQRLVAAGLMGSFMALIFTAFFLLLYGPKLTDWLAAHLGFGVFFSVLWTMLEWALVLGAVLMAFNILYIYAPNIKRHRWHWLMPGTVVGVGLWLLVSFAFKAYLTYFDRYSLTYGSLGAVIILLMWFYLTGIAVLVGAEFNSQIEKECGQVPEVKEKPQ